MSASTNDNPAPSRDLHVIPPGETLGMLGAGQLGRMFAAAAKRMGYRVHIYADHPDAPAVQVSDTATVASFDDTDALDRFTADVAAASLEFENIPATAVEHIARAAVMRPNAHLLHTTQNRLREKTFLHEHHLPVVPFRSVCSLADLTAALADLGLPAILKTAASGYDGKGQVRINAAHEAPDAWERVGQQPCVLEAFMPFEDERSVIVARNARGDVRCYPLFENHHENHILDVTTCAPLDTLTDERLAIEANDIAQRVVDAFQLEGLLCIELFRMPDDRLVINEIAPRPHNSGHLTIEACATSQFEQQVRALCNLPLGNPALHRPAAMCNLLGDVWRNGEPNWEAALARPGIQLHLYGKGAPRPGRKMGHLTALADSVEEARANVLAARTLLWQTAGSTDLPASSADAASGDPA